MEDFILDTTLLEDILLTRAVYVHRCISKGLYIEKIGSILTIVFSNCICVAIDKLNLGFRLLVE